MSETTPEATQEQPSAAPTPPMALNVELPQDLLAFAAQSLQRPVEAVAPVIAQVVGQMVIRGLGVRVMQPQQQPPGIAIARALPPTPRMGRP